MGFALNDTIADDLRTSTDATGKITYTVRASVHRTPYKGDDINTTNAFRWIGDITVRDNVIDTVALLTSWRKWCTTIPRNADNVPRDGLFECEIMAAVTKAITEHRAGTLKSFDLPPA